MRLTNKGCPSAASVADLQNLVDRNDMSLGHIDAWFVAEGRVRRIGVRYALGDRQGISRSHQSPVLGATRRGIRPFMTEAAILREEPILAYEISRSRQLEAHVTHN